MTVESDGQAQMLISTTHASTNRDVGLTLSASSNGQEYTLGLNRASNTFVIAPTDVNSAPENAVFELDAVGNITASGNISSSGTIKASDITLQKQLGDSTFLTLLNKNALSDISNQTSFLEFSFVDSNANNYPQVNHNQWIT